MKTSRVLKTIAVRKRSHKALSIALVLLVSSALTLSAAKRPKMVLYAASGTFGVAGTLYTIDQTTGAVLTTVGRCSTPPATLTGWVACVTIRSTASSTVPP